MLSCIRFEALLNTDGDPDCPWPTQDPYRRYGAEHFAKDGAIIWQLGRTGSGIFQTSRRVTVRTSKNMGKIQQL